MILPSGGRQRADPDVHVTSATGFLAVSVRSSRGMKSLNDSLSAPLLAAPVPRPGQLSLFAYLRVLRDNLIATYPKEAYERDVLERRVFGSSRLLVNEPAAIKRVLLDNAANYRKTEIVRRILEPGLGKGLITSEGETWRRHRRTMSPAFDLRSVASYASIITGAAQELLTTWRGLGAGACVDVAPAMMQVTLNIISRTMFSSDSDHIVAIMERGAGRYQSEMRPNIMDFLKFPAWLAGLPRRRVAQRTLREFDEEIDRLIKSRSDGARGPNDLLARLMAARDGETGGGMSEQEVRDQVITIFMAGHETTANAMTWTWYLLSQHPAEEAKLHAELDSVLNGRAPDSEDLSKLIYTRMVIDESLRLYPPAHIITREAMAEDFLAGRRVPKGTNVLIAPWVLHRHVKLWQDPGRFDPERFRPESMESRPRFAYLPFGGGRRVCIGAAFATAEATLLLATIAQRFRLQLAAGHPVEAQALITLRARHGMKMVLARRA
jgi:cytochrome P450